ncbi:MAG: HEAT repeat domain-containing protein, partial [Roseibacillus sp.]|nr:HEAT repeat domain-containing protein [Roseibacillus sp.]
MPALAAVLYSFMALSGAAQEVETGGAEELLESLLPDRERVLEFQRRIEQLGSEQFKERKAAMEQLLAASLIPAGVLDRGLESEEPEIRNRTREIVRRGGARKSQMVFEEALRAMVKESRKGLLGKVVEVMESGVEVGDAALAAHATAGTVEEGDLALLARLAGGKNAIGRRMAAAGGEVLGPRGAGILQPLLKDGDSAVKLQAAVALANLGSLEGARTLGEFLFSDHASERMKAWKGLLSLTGREFGYNALDGADKRREAAIRWTEFLKGEVVLVGKVEQLKSIQLFNGKDLTG